MDSIIQILDLANKILDKPGPFYIDTRIYRHTSTGDEDDYDKQRKGDLVKIGLKDKPVTMSQVVSAFKRVQKKMPDDFQFEQISKKRGSGGNTYEITWR